MKTRIMKPPFLYLLIAPLLTCSSCHMFRTKLHFTIINNSRAKRAVDMIIKYAGDTVFQDTIRWNNVHPDLSHVFEVPAVKGNAEMQIIADGGLISRSDRIDGTDDQWIVITFDGNSTGDQMQLSMSATKPILNE